MGDNFRGPWASGSGNRSFLWLKNRNKPRKGYPGDDGIRSQWRIHIPVDCPVKGGSGRALPWLLREKKRTRSAEREVPAEAYFGIQTQRAIDNYPISGLKAHFQLIRAVGMIKKAAAIANEQLGLLDKKKSGAIVRAAEEVVAGKFDDHFRVDVYQAGAGVSFHMNANEVIANRAIELLGGQRGDYALCHPNDHVNFGQSTNDVFPTAMRLAAVILLDEVLEAIAILEKSFARKGKEFDHILKSGRTHLMDAVPVRLGQEFAAYATALRRCAGVIHQAQDLLREVGLGGSAVGTGVNTHPKYQKLVVTELSKVSRQRLIPTDDLRYAMQSNLALSVASSALRSLALELIRISNDLRLLSSGPNTGLAEIGLPALQPGSLDHAGQSESRDGGADRHGELPGCWRGHRHGARSSSGATGTECDDACYGLERLTFGGNSEKLNARIGREVRGRYCGE